ncbi:MAG: aldo/keto reductase [Treponemataceae bacterium]|nr:aldo/keto reductase [Treponemataceae bacterium]
MDYVRLGKSNLMTSRVAMGAMSLAKIGDADKAAELVRKAYTRGINLFDTARTCPGCEQILGDAVGDIRASVMLATKTSAESGAEIFSDVETSLNVMHTDFIDIYQYESNRFLPEPDGRDGVYNALLAMKSAGKIRHIGIATQDLDIAGRAVRSGLYETLQFPFSMISAAKTIELVKLCEQNDVGFIAMQPLCGGLVENIPLAFGFLHQYESVVPLWGVQTEQELEQILYFNERPPVIDEQFKADVERLRQFFN